MMGVKGRLYKEFRYSGSAFHVPNDLTSGGLSLKVGTDPAGYFNVFAQHLSTK